MASKFERKYQMQKYSPFIAFNMPSFREALRYFVQQMRVTDFVRAHDRLHKKYGVTVAVEVEIFCQEMVITCRPTCGRLFLADGYEKRMP